VDEDDQDKGERPRGWWLLGVVGLAAWFAMLYFMFGDVL
jgi:hypothetical protein